MKENINLTGKIRYRPTGFFKKKLVLQVEIRYLKSYYCRVYGVETDYVTEWRDATLEDFSVLELAG
jgi:hypothetical protein